VLHHIDDVRSRHCAIAVDVSRSRAWLGWRSALEHIADHVDDVRSGQIAAQVDISREGDQATTDCRTIPKPNPDLIIARGRGTGHALPHRQPHAIVRGRYRYRAAAIDRMPVNGIVGGRRCLRRHGLLRLIRLCHLRLVSCGCLRSARRIVSSRSVHNRDQKQGATRRRQSP